jgi:hypothetical protein
MNTFSNQDIVEVQKEPCDKNNLYAAINLEAMRLAVKDLTPIQFQVWLYFAKNQAGYTFAVSPAAALNEFGIKKDTFQKAKQVLKQKGYLIENPSKGKNHWIFKEIPEEEVMYVEKQ